MLLSAPPPPQTRSLVPDPVSQRESERQVFGFYCLVRSGAPVWRLEEVRLMEVQVCDRDQVRPLSESQALVYALVHNRTDYTRLLLRRYALSALRSDPCSFCMRSVGAVHLRLAVRYDRQEALELILQTLQTCMAPDERQSYLDSAPLCSHLDCAEAAVPLAIEVHRSRCLLLLLATGATATGLEAGLRALEAELQREAGLRRGVGLTEHTEALRCIYFLLLFGSAPTPRPLDPRLQCILGEQLFHWVSGMAPPTLLLHALRTLARTAPASIAQLPPGLSADTALPRCPQI